jgi:hypothetical protein
MLRKIALVAGGAFLALHGVAHLVGTLDAWRLVEPEGGFRTAIVDGRLELGTAGMAAFGGLWLLAALGFVVAGYALVRRRHWFAPLTASFAAGSLVLSALAWPEAWIGVAVNAVLLAALTLAAVRRGSHPVPSH